MHRGERKAHVVSIEMEHEKAFGMNLKGSGSVHLGHVVRATLSKNNVALLQDDVLSALYGRLETRSAKAVDCEVPKSTCSTRT